MPAVTVDVVSVQLWKKKDGNWHGDVRVHVPWSGSTMKHHLLVDQVEGDWDVLFDDVDWTACLVALQLLGPKMGWPLMLGMFGCVMAFNRAAVAASMDADVDLNALFKEGEKIAQDTGIELRYGAGDS